MYHFVMNHQNNTVLSRRLFIAISSMAFAGCVISSKKVYSTKLGRLMFSFLTGTPLKHYIMLMDLDANRSEIFETPHNIHSLEPYDLNNDIFVGAPRVGSYYSMVDLKTLKTHPYEMPKDLMLMGHSAVTPDGKFICATARKEKTGTNCIAFLDKKTFQPFETVDLPEGYPPNHDCKFLPNSNLLATTAAQNISLVDYKTKKVRIEKVAFENPMSQVRHFTVGPDGKLAIQSNSMFGVEPSSLHYQDGAVVTYDPGRNESRVLDPTVAGENIFDRELVDFQFDETGEFFAVTAQNYHYVTFWNFKTGKLIANIPLHFPIRVTLSANKDYFIIITGKGLRYIHAKTLKLNESMNQFEALIEERIFKNYLNGIYTVVAHRQTIA